VGKKQPCQWLKFGDIKEKTESTIVAAQNQAVSTTAVAQDQAVGTNHFKKNNLKKETESRCRLCKVYKETTDRLTSKCLILAKNENVVKHDEVHTHLHYLICKTLSRH
jgi:hypothetical protein